MISSRAGHCSWITPSGEIFVFGGGAVYGKTNDLWKFSGPVGIWIGAASQAWEDPLNWSSGVIPNANIDVVINSGTVLVNSNVTIRSLKLNISLTLTVNPNNHMTILK